MNRRPERLADLLPGVVADLAARHNTTNGAPMTEHADIAGLTWEEPPAAAFPRRFHSRWEEVSAQLRAHPGQWAKLDITDIKNPKTFAYNVKNGQTKAWRPQGAFEAVCTPDRQVYARYVGDAQDGAA